MDNQEGDDRDGTEHVVMLVGMRAATSTNDVIEEGVSANHKIGRVRYRILRTLALFSAFIMLVSRTTGRPCILITTIIRLSLFLSGSDYVVICIKNYLLFNYQRILDVYYFIY